MLFVGPGRSGTSLLFENFRRHPQLDFPETIKEGYFYRSPKKAINLMSSLRKKDKKTLTDFANMAYRDDAMPSKINLLSDAGFKIALVVTMRKHHDLAAAVMKFRKSRGEFSALFGNYYLERRVVEDRLTAERLLRIYETKSDVIVVDFETLISDIPNTLDTLFCVFSLHPVSSYVTGVVNHSTAARFPFIQPPLKGIAVAMHKLGFRRTLQRIKDNNYIMKCLFKPLSNTEETELTTESLGLLADSAMKCRAMVAARSGPSKYGVFMENSKNSSHDRCSLTLDR